MSQTKFGKIIGKGKAIISKYENNLMVPDEETLKKIADFGGVSVEWLLRGDPSRLSFLVGQFSGEMAKEDRDVVSISPKELVAAITLVEKVIFKHKLKLSPGQKARLIVRIYADCLAQHLQPDSYMVERALLLVD